MRAMDLLQRRLMTPEHYERELQLRVNRDVVIRLLQERLAAYVEIASCIT